MESILVIAAHPDDETIGCGGTITKHVENGDNVHVLFMSYGVGSRNDSEYKQEVAKRITSAEQALILLGVKNHTILDNPDNKFDTLPMLGLAQQIENILAKTQPTIVYTHHGSDLNIDHRITFQAALTALRPQPGNTCKAIYCFEINSSTEWSAPALGPSFQPNYYVNIAEHIDAKKQALLAYNSEMHEYPHTRSIDAITALAQVRGSSVGVPYAEAFMIIRKIDM